MVANATNKTFIIYKIFGLCLIFLTTLICFICREEYPSSPIMMTSLVLGLILIFKKLSCQDLLFISKFALFFLLALIVSGIAAITSGYSDKSMFLAAFCVLSLGILWGFNNPKGNYIILKNKYKDSNAIIVLRHLLGGIVTIVIGASLCITSSKDYTIPPITLTAFGIISTFYGALLLSTTLANIFQMLALEEVSEICIAPQKKLLNNKKKYTGTTYKIFSILCCLIIICLLFFGISVDTTSIFYTMPTAMAFSFLVYKLIRKTYNYKETIILDKQILYIFCAAILTSLLSIDDNSNLLLFNCNYYKFYNMTIITLMGTLVSFNNVITGYNYFIKIYNRGYSNLYQLTATLLLASIGTLIAKDAYKMPHEIIYYIIPMSVIAFASLFVSGFISYIIIFYKQLSK